MFSCCKRAHAKNIVSPPRFPLLSLWSDPSRTHVVLNCLPQWRKSPVATCPHRIVIFLFRSICLIRFRPLLKYRRLLHLQKSRPVLPLLHHRASPFFRLLFSISDIVLVQFVLEFIKLCGHLLKSPLLYFFVLLLCFQLSLQDR